MSRRTSSERSHASSFERSVAKTPRTPSDPQLPALRSRRLGISGPPNCGMWIVARKWSFWAAMMEVMGSLRAPVLFVDGHQEQDALSLGQLDRDQVEGEDAALLAGPAGPDGADLFGTGEDVLALAVPPP